MLLSIRGRPQARSTPLPYTTLFRSPADLSQPQVGVVYNVPGYSLPELAATGNEMLPPTVQPSEVAEHSRSQIRFGRSGLYRSEEHTSELQSRGHLVCRLVLDKKNNR